MKKAADGIVTVTKTYIDGSGQLFNTIIDKFDLKNDAGLSRWLEVAPPAVSKVRHDTLPIGATMTVKILEKTDWSLKYVRELIAGGAQ